MGPRSLLLAACLLALGAGLAAGAVDWEWHYNGRATFYGGQEDPWTIHAGSCQYYYLDANVGTGWDIAAISDWAPDYTGSCGRCYEVACSPEGLKDGYGAYFDRYSVCRDPDASVVVQITDTCPCNYPSNYYSNKRWCCNDRYHFDLSVWAFERLADPKWGMIALKYREVPCDHCPDKPAKLPDGQWPYKFNDPKPSNWKPSDDKRPSTNRKCAPVSPYRPADNSKTSTGGGSSAWAVATATASSTSGSSSASASATSPSTSPSAPSPPWASANYAWINWGTKLAETLFDTATGWMGMSKNMRPWPTKDTEGKGGQCGGAWDYGMMSFKTGIGGLNGKKRISFKVQLVNNNIPDFSVTLVAAGKGECQTLSLQSLKPYKWDGGWATIDIPLSGFSWQQKWDGSTFEGCSSAIGTWDVNQVDFRSNQKKDQKVCISDIRFY